MKEFKKLLDEIMPRTLRPAQRKKRFADFLKSFMAIKDKSILSMSEPWRDTEARKWIDGFQTKGVPETFAKEFRAWFPQWINQHVSEGRSGNAKKGWVGVAGKKRREKLKKENTNPESEKDHGRTLVSDRAIENNMHHSTPPIYPV